MAAPLCKNGNGLGTHIFERPFAPIRSVNHIIRFIFTKIGLVIWSFLHDDLINAFNIFNHSFALFITHKGKSFIGSNGLICKKANHYFAEFLRNFNNIQMPRMNKINSHWNINEFFLLCHFRNSIIEYMLDKVAVLLDFLLCVFFLILPLPVNSKFHKENFYECCRPQSFVRDELRTAKPIHHRE